MPCTRHEWTVHFWTDSTIALGWITGGPYRWKEFVRNRVDAIRLTSNPEQWRHCPGIDNPADIASRGASADNLMALQRWWQGPSWLKLESCHWPEPGGAKEADLEEISEEAKKNVTKAAVINEPPV